MDQEKLQQGVQFLSEQGLNLCAILACPALPDEVVHALDGARGYVINMGRIK